MSSFLTPPQRTPKPKRKSSNIKVFTRIRPLAQKELGGPQCVRQLNQKQLMILPAHRENCEKTIFAFDQVFEATATQAEVYETVTDSILDNVFEGINGTIFCYGQTSSGKTYTCIGQDFVDERERGILPRSISQIFGRMSGKPRNIECKMTLSLIEIYNEKIRDLLDTRQQGLKIRENKSQGIFVNGATEKYLLSEQEAYSLIQRGIDSRAVGCTNMNAYSSRSHMMVLIRLHQHDLYTGEAKVAKLIMVDLAGCEKLSRTGTEGKMLEEAKKINTSLSMLGKVINILSEGKKKHIPYRDSKLTRLLQESLGGNCITSLIINISPAGINEAESVLSLKFGCRAQSIRNEPRVNKEYTVPELLSLLSKAEQKISQQNRIIANLLKRQSPDENDNQLNRFLRSFNQENQSKMGSIDWARRSREVSDDNFMFKDVTECLESADCQSVDDQDSSIRRSMRNCLSAHFLSPAQFLPEKSLSLSDLIEAGVGLGAKSKSKADVLSNQGCHKNFRSSIPPLEFQHIENESEEDGNSEGTRNKTKRKASTRRLKSERPTKEELVICQIDSSSTQGMFLDRTEGQSAARQKLTIQSVVSFSVCHHKKVTNETPTSSSATDHSKIQQSTACKSNAIETSIVPHQQVLALIDKDIHKLNILQQSLSTGLKSTAMSNIERIRNNMKRLATLKKHEFSVPMTI